MAATERGRVDVLACHQVDGRDLRIGDQVLAALAEHQRGPRAELSAEQIARRIGSAGTASLRRALAQDRTR